MLKFEDDLIYMNNFAYLMLHDQKGLLTVSVLMIPKELEKHQRFINEQLIASNRDVLFLDWDTSPVSFQEDVIAYTSDGDKLILLKHRNDYLSIANKIQIDVFRFFKSIPDFRGRLAKYMLLGDMRQIISDSDAGRKWERLGI